MNAGRRKMTGWSPPGRLQTMTSMATDLTARPGPGGRRAPGTMLIAERPATS